MIGAVDRLAPDVSVRRTVRVVRFRRSGAVLLPLRCEKTSLSFVLCGEVSTLGLLCFRGSLTPSPCVVRTIRGCLPAPRATVMFHVKH